MQKERIPVTSRYPSLSPSGEADILRRLSDILLLSRNPFSGFQAKNKDRQIRYLPERSSPIIPIDTYSFFAYFTAVLCFRPHGAGRRQKYPWIRISAFFPLLIFCPGREKERSLANNRSRGADEFRRRKNLVERGGCYGKKGRVVELHRPAVSQCLDERLGFALCLHHQFWQQYGLRRRYGDPNRDRQPHRGRTQARRCSRESGRHKGLHHKPRRQHGLGHRHDQ